MKKSQCLILIGLLFVSCTDSFEPSKKSFDVESTIIELEGFYVMSGQKQIPYKALSAGATSLASKFGMTITPISLSQYNDFFFHSTGGRINACEGQNVVSAETVNFYNGTIWFVYHFSDGSSQVSVYTVSGGNVTFIEKYCVALMD